MSKTCIPWCIPLLLFNTGISASRVLVCVLRSFSCGVRFFRFWQVPKTVMEDREITVNVPRTVQVWKFPLKLHRNLQHTHIFYD